MTSTPSQANNETNVSEIKEERELSTSTKLLLGAGVIASPLFIAVTVIQQLTREGVNAKVQPLSLLSLGDLGWIQITNFVVCGLLAFAAAFGIRRQLRGQTAGTWGPILIGWFGLALVYGGVFVADPAFGFPVGQAPAEAAPVSEWSWHSMLHTFAAPMAGLTVIAAAIVFARRFRRENHRTLANLAWAAVGGYVVLSGLGFGLGDFRIVLAAATVLWLVPTMVCWHLLRRND